MSGTVADDILASERHDHRWDRYCYHADGHCVFCRRTLIDEDARTEMPSETDCRCFTRAEYSERRWGIGWSIEHLTTKMPKQRGMWILAPRRSRLDSQNLSFNRAWNHNGEDIQAVRNDLTAVGCGLERCVKDGEPSC
jgi:hypothetical protein